MITGILTLGSCLHRQGSRDVTKLDKINENREMPRDLVYKILDQRVNKYMQISYNCAQSTYLALEEQFGLDGDDILKALTPLPGIAERGETCGAVTGSLMIFGQVYGRERHQLGDWEIYRNSLVPAGNFCRLFEKEFGSTMCRDIQKKEYGRSYNLTDPQDLTEFQAADATTHCSNVVRTAVRLAADVILDDSNEHQ